MPRGPIGFGGERLSVTAWTLPELMTLAYGSGTTLYRFQISGGPDWLDRERFDITATVNESTIVTKTPTLVQDMLKALLAERFKLAVREETKEAPIYVLTLASRDGQLGPKLRRSTYPCPDPGAGPPPPPDPERLKNCTASARTWARPGALVRDRARGTVDARLRALTAAGLQPYRGTTRQEPFARLNRGGEANTPASRAGITVAIEGPRMGGDMTRAASVLAAGLGLGAGLMYYLDPNRGSRRRTHARNQVIHASHRVRDQWQSLRQTSGAGAHRRQAWTSRLAWTNGHAAGARRVAAALAGAASIGLAARSALNARTHEFELRS